MATSEALPEMNWNPWISSAADSPARTSARPESGQALKDLAQAFGLSLPVWWGDWDPDGYSLKTSQVCLFTEQCEELSETWPDSGMWDAGAVYELRNSEPPTSESACSLWPTARTTDQQSGRGAIPSGTTFYRPSTAFSDGNKIGQANLSDVAEMWPTPNVPNGGRTGNTSNYRNDGSKRQIDLAAITTRWASPTGHDGRRPGSDATSTMGANLKRDAERWQTPQFFPTPAARDYRTPNRQAYQNRSGTLKGEQLQNFVEHRFDSHPAPPTAAGPQSSATGQTSRRRFPTPSASMATMQDMEQAQYAGNSPVRPKYADLEKRRLNPRFVEWLMDLPIGWTEL